ncbi:hypothetical protein BU16DRAFT_384413 [Lophium mytilinum]|uniref:BRCT domain-containing protein n=1 Tax=Lophium mytilinum TaxID=390894 RepID=A0A6A6QST7_9PEZI|nr:hypothetical protein BU16DRAFT_384413 [Lophium mytilinum]
MRGQGGEDNRVVDAALKRKRVQGPETAGTRGEGTKRMRVRDVGVSVEGHDEHMITAKEKADTRRNWDAEEDSRFDPPPSGQELSDSKNERAVLDRRRDRSNSKTTAFGRTTSSSTHTATTLPPNDGPNISTRSRPIPTPTSSKSTSVFTSAPTNTNISTTFTTPMDTTQPVTRAALPTRKIFDAWNSSSTGHQRAENRLGGSTDWRHSRQKKLSAQFTSGMHGGRRIADTVGAGSFTFGKDGRKANGGWEAGASGLRGAGQSDVKSWLTQERKRDTKSVVLLDKQTDDGNRGTREEDPNTNTIPDPQLPQIFTSLTFYINGSTAPLVSDHKLKRLLASHGAALAQGLARRSVTHVVLGTENARGGVGGGLAGTKIQKEVARTGGKAVRFVGVEWVLESIKAGRRLPESRFEGLKLAPEGQGSVLEAFRVREGG